MVPIDLSNVNEGTKMPWLEDKKRLIAFLIQAVSFSPHGKSSNPNQSKLKH